MTDDSIDKTNDNTAPADAELRVELMYRAGDIRTLALDHPARADFLVSLGDLIDGLAETTLVSGKSERGKLN